MLKIPQIQSQFVAISGGMDLTTPPIVKANSEAIMALNVQPNYEGGFSRIEGFECIDGRTTPSDMMHFSIMLDRVVDSLHIGKTFQLSSKTCHIIDINDNIIVVAVLGKLTSHAGDSFRLESQEYRLLSTPLIDAGDIEKYQHYQAKAFQVGVNLVQEVPGDGNVLGVVELHDQIIAFRNQDEKCGVFIATESGWQTPQKTYVAHLKEITNPKDLIDGIEFSIGSKKSTILSAVLSADDSAGFIVTTMNISNEAQITISGRTVAKVKSCDEVLLGKDGVWQFIYHNFYGSPHTQYAYGCNGLQVIEVRPNGIIIPIATYTENPTYICSHRNHLFISFKGGQFGHSLVGSPTKWSVILGAEQFSVGDEITALSSTVGGVLLIGCKHKVTALYGSTRDDWVLKDISRVGVKSGTLQNVFMPIAVSQHGIIRIDQTEQFGDFKLSETDSSRKLGFKPVENNIIYSSTKAKSNQVRFYSENALHICMMLMPDGQTKCSYFNYPQKIKGVWQSHHYTFLAFSDGKVYRQSDKCYSFSGEPIDWVVKMAFNHCGSPIHIKSWKSAELQATAKGMMKFQYRFDLDYNSDFHSPNLPREIQAVGDGGRWNESLWNDFLWSVEDYSTPSLHLHGHSKNISISFSGSSLYSPQFELTGLILNFIPRRFQRV
ncbi:hypothetical protein [Pasteurella sp. PK-2025]|uniref:hypothetical protein n=1 Tax=Pasteurella sp. PK-2025 TaxID=3413133 RepID=UPI003C73EC65